MGDDQEFQIGSGNWSQQSRSSRCSSSPPPSSSTHNWPIQVVDVTKQPHEQPRHQDHPNLQHMMGLGLSSQPVEWNQSLFLGIEKSDESCSFRSMLQEDNDHSSSSTTSFQQAEQQWPPRSQKIMMYSSSSSAAATAVSEGVFSSLNPSQFMSSRPHHHLNPINVNHSSTSTTGGFQIDSSSSIRYQNNPSTTSMLPGLLGYEINHQPPRQPSTPTMSNFTSYTSFGMNSSLSSDHDNQQLMLQPKSWQGSNISEPQNQLHLSNNAPFWNASPAAPIINHDVRSNLFPSLQMQYSPSSTLDEKPKKSSSSETSNKRPRNETTSPLPAKAKKEKMGDRITALQQLVSPFGKTDTASVLAEAIEYIKFLHEQVSVLSNAYMKSGAPTQQQESIVNYYDLNDVGNAMRNCGIQKCEKSNDQEGQQQDLRSRGLCLVPVSSTFAVTHETTVDFWNPTFGGSFR